MLSNVNQYAVNSVAYDDEREKKLKKYILLSLLVHLFGIFMLQYASLVHWNLASIEKSETIEIELVQPTDVKTRSQIVETDLVEKKDKAIEDAFLSSQNQVVETQTKAKINGAFRNGHIGAESTNTTSEPRRQPKLSLSNLGVPVNMKPLGNLTPGEQAQSNDYIKDVQDGAQTMLNTKEFAFFSFYQRVRRQLEQYWEPGLRDRLQKMLDRGRTIASDREHNTRILVVMNPEGVITGIQVENTSGLSDLDQAAIDAFNRAGPFPNPPKGMIGADGTVKVEWEFVLKT